MCYHGHYWVILLNKGVEFLSIAIVTGASSGLGREFVIQIAQKENVDEIWVIARRADRLRLLSKEVTIPIRPIEADLLKLSSIAHISSLMEEMKPDVSILVNAAGFAKLGDYNEIANHFNRELIDLNCRALVDMTMAVLPYMKKGARIIQISSSASFQPMPGLNVYTATKVFVQYYSRALRWELKDRGINVSAVCPYWVKDTEFIAIAEAEGGRGHYPLASKSKSVVKRSLRASKFNLPVSTPGLVCFLDRIIVKIIPREIIMRLINLLR